MSHLKRRSLTQAEQEDVKQLTKSQYESKKYKQVGRSAFLTSWSLKVTTALVTLLFLLYLWVVPYQLKDHEGFIKVKGVKLELDCRPFYLAGFNAHDLMEVAMLTPSDYQTDGGLSGRQIITRMFQQASRAGLNSVRTWAHTSDPRFPFQSPGGIYNERAFQGLDFVLETARRNGIKVILSFIDNWKYYNGVDQFVDWSQTVLVRNRVRKQDDIGDPKQFEQVFGDEDGKRYEVERHALFFSDEDTRKIYKKHVVNIVNRVNRYNGRVYKEDPTIMAWDLINEPRCEEWMVKNCPQLLQQWVEEMSSFVRQNDPNHLIAFGSEGFFRTSHTPTHKTNYQHLNPQRWAGEMGQDFITNNLAPNIDIVSIHVWPENWDRLEFQFQTRWIESHVELSERVIQKPLVVEEFGKKLSLIQDQNEVGIKALRDPVYTETYKVVEKYLEGALAGSLFWQWNMPKFAGVNSGDYGIQPKDTTFKIILQHTKFVKEQNHLTSPGSSCQTECWIADGSWGCKHQPDHCINIQNTNQLVFTSKAACCRPGSGAFESGCWL